MVFDDVPLRSGEAAYVVRGDPSAVVVSVVISPPNMNLLFTPARRLAVDAHGCTACKRHVGLHSRPVPVLPRPDQVEPLGLRRGQIFLARAGEGEAGHWPNISALPARAGPHLHHGAHVHLHHGQHGSDTCRQRKKSPAPPRGQRWALKLMRLCGAGSFAQQVCTKSIKQPASLPVLLIARHPPVNNQRFGKSLVGGGEIGLRL